VQLLTDPWAWWITPFLDNAFMQRALIGGLLTAVTTSIVGTWVVLRGLTFLGDALAHGVLPGIAIAFLLGQSTTLGVVVLYRALLVMTFDETLARMLGLRPRLTHFALLALIAISIVGSFSTVGNLLVFAFLVAPPAAAALLAKRVLVIMLLATLLGALACVVGLLVSYHHRTAAGASMALCSVVLFFVVLLATALRRRLVATR
jgi:ABC-type Mn2+/Zn2+ transport system permease subunit